MGNFRAFSLACLLACFLAGCASGGGEDVPPPSPPASAFRETGAAKEPEEAAPPAGPAKEDVLAAREDALAGMPREQAGRLAEAVKTANLWLEQEYLCNDLFGKLADPDSLYWNYFDRAGEIQIAWAYDGSLDMEAVCRAENLTEDAFYAKYGTAVSAVNRRTADDFITLMEELEASAQNEALKAELRGMAEEMELAKGHEMEHVNTVYKKLHDLDYFLLRYGPEVLDSYQSNYDTSTVCKYYGTLSFYEGA